MARVVTLTIAWLCMGVGVTSWLGGKGVVDRVGGQVYVANLSISFVPCFRNVAADKKGEKRKKMKKGSLRENIKVWSFTLFNYWTWLYTAGNYLHFEEIFNSSSLLWKYFLFFAFGLVFVQEQRNTNVLLHNLTPCLQQTGWVEVVLLHTLTPCLQLTGWVEVVLLYNQTPCLQLTGWVDVALHYNLTPCL